MRVANILSFSSYWGEHLPAHVLDLIDGPTIGGGEEAGFRTAEGLKRKGHQVELWWYGQDGHFRGMPVHSLKAPLYSRLASEPWDAVVEWSGLKALEVMKHRKETVRLFANQLNDLWTLGDWNSVDCIVSPSASHAEQLNGWGWKNRPHAVVHNGLDPKVYADTPEYLRRPLNVGCWSSPDRGLHHLLRAWPEVTMREPTAQLHVFYEIKRYLSGAVQMGGPLGERARVLSRLILDRLTDPTVTFHGAQTRTRLAQWQRNIRVQCYPYDPTGYCEGFGTSVAQGFAAGCRVLTTAKDAFPTLYPEAQWLDSTRLTDTKYIADQVIEALHTPPTAASQPSGLRYSWEAAAQQMEDAILRKNWVTP